MIEEFERAEAGARHINIVMAESVMHDPDDGNSGTTLQQGSTACAYLQFAEEQRLLREPPRILSLWQAAGEPEQELPYCSKCDLARCAKNTTYCHRCLLSLQRHSPPAELFLPPDPAVDAMMFGPNRNNRKSARGKRGAASRAKAKTRKSNPKVADLANTAMSRDEKLVAATAVEEQKHQVALMKDESANAATVEDDLKAGELDVPKEVDKDNSTAEGDERMDAQTSNGESVALAIIMDKSPRDPKAGF